ncbi:MAG: T9SS type A sorting domain-containing protein [Saprospiraceae bacterium]
MNRVIIFCIIFLQILFNPSESIAQIDTFGLQCNNAPVFSISEINGWRGRNPDFVNANDGPSPLCPTGGGAHNLGWWSFYTPGGKHNFEIEFDNCTVNGTGVQFGIYTDCSFSENVVCDPSCNGPGKKSFSAVLEPFKLYYMFVDGCEADVCDFIIKTDQPKDYLNAQVFIDANEDCIFQNPETKVDVLTIVHEFKGKKYFYPSNIGKIPLYDRDLGTHKFSIKEISSAVTSCQAEYVINVDFIQPIPDLNIGIKKNGNCEQLQTEVATDRLRFCNNVEYTVHYSNISVEDIDNSYIEVTIPEVFTFVTSTLTPSNINLPLIRFDLGNLKGMTKGSFKILLKTPCEPQYLGNTYCVESHIYPDNPCPKPGSWDKSSLKLKGICDKTNNLVKFSITNVGGADMALASEFAIIEDEIMPLLKGSVKLKMNEEKVFDYPANGRTYRMLLQQPLNHPGNSRPTIFVEGCGVNPNGETSKGFATSFANDEDDKFKSVDCKVLRGSYDPNDKLSEPKGFGTDHFIENNQPIEYTIRFQNTGNDYAERVRVVDRLDQGLDVNSFELIGNSHPMNYSIRDGVIEFVFDNINLPYAGINEIGSNGYVSFRINLKSDLNVGAVVKNHAEIYFDKNQPIITNETHHTLFWALLTQVYSSTDYSFAKMYPNPAQNELKIDLRDVDLPIKLDLITIDGTVRHQQLIQHAHISLDLEQLQLKDGLYLINLRNKKGDVSIHKLIIKR